MAKKTRSQFKRSLNRYSKTVERFALLSAAVIAMLGLALGSYDMASCREQSRIPARLSLGTPVCITVFAHSRLIVR